MCVHRSPLIRCRTYSAVPKVEIRGNTPIPPPPFVISHERRTASFELFGRGPGGESILINSQLPTYESRRPSNNLPPVTLWHAAVIREDFTMDLTCSTLNDGILSIDGMCFYNSPVRSCEDSVAAYQQRRATYQGPGFHNGLLASLMLGIPIINTVHPRRQYARNWYNPYQGILTKYTKYDHMPVHTINPDLYDAFLQYVGEVGITDDLAAFVSQYSLHIYTQESQLWYNDINSILSRKEPLS